MIQRHTMSDPVVEIKILARAELALAQIRMHYAIGRSVLFVVAVVFALISLVMLNVAGFYALVASQGAAMAALIVALGDLTLSAVLVWVARHTVPKEKDERLAREVRDLAYAEINHDIEQVKSELNKFTDDVRSIRAGFTSFSDGALHAITPLLGMLFKSFK